MTLADNDPSPTNEALELEVARLRAILQHATSAVVTLDRNGNVESLSQVAEALFGWKSDQLVGRPIKRLFHAAADAATDGEEIWDRLVEANGRLVELMLPRKDGSWFQAEAAVVTVALAGSGGSYQTLIARELSDRRRMERLLRDAEATMRRQAEEAAELATA